MLQPTFVIRMPYTGDISANRYLARTKIGFAVRKLAKEWAELLSLYLRPKLPRELWGDRLDPARPFELTVAVAFPKKFSSTSGDAPNFDKFPRDTIARILEIDDAGTSSGGATGTYGNGKAGAFVLLMLTLFPKIPGEYDPVELDVTKDVGNYLGKTIQVQAERKDLVSPKRPRRVRQVSPSRKKLRVRET